VVAQARVVLVVGARPPSVLITQARSRSEEPSIMATGAATLAERYRRGGGDPAANATAWAAMACWWVIRNPVAPLAASPKAKCMSPSRPAVLASAASNVSRIPSGSQAPRARFVARQEHGIGGAVRLPRDVADRVLKPGDVVDGGRGVARPADQATVVWRSR